MLLLLLVPGYYVIIRQLAAKDVKRAADGDVHAASPGTAYALQIFLKETQGRITCHSNLRMYNCTSTLQHTTPPAIHMRHNLLHSQCCKCNIIDAIDAHACMELGKRMKPRVLL